MGLRGVDDKTHKKLVELSEGVLIESDVLGVIADIQAYDDNLVVQFLDPSRAELFDAPYQIMEKCPDGLLRPVMQIWTLDKTVLERIRAADTRGGDLLAGLEKNNEAAKKAQKRRYRDETEAVSEMVRDVLRSPKDTYTATNPVTGQKHKFRSVKNSDDRPPEPAA